MTALRSGETDWPDTELALEGFQAVEKMQERVVTHGAAKGWAGGVRGLREPKEEGKDDREGIKAWRPGGGPQRVTETPGHRGESPFPLTEPPTQGAILRVAWSGQALPPPQPHLRFSPTPSEAVPSC